MSVNFKNTFNLLPLFFLILIWLSLGCDKDLRVYSNTEFKTVVLGTIQPDQNWKITIAKSKNFAPKSRQTAVDDAQVTILNQDSIVDVLLYNPIDSSFESSLGHLPKSGEEYTIDVQITGEKTVSAKDKIPEIAFVFIDSIFLSSQTTSFLEFGFSITDTNPYEGYFQLSFFEKVYDKSSASPSLLAIKAIENYLINDFDNQFDSEPKTSGIKLINNMGYLYKDDDLSDIPSKTIYVRVPIQELEHNTANNISSEIFIDLRTVSDNYYYFYSDVTEQVGSENPIAFPVSVHNNIYEGIGNFSSYSVVNCILKL